MPQRSSSLETFWVKFKERDYVLMQPRYANGRTALLLIDLSTGDPAACATVNLLDHDLHRNEVLISDSSGNEGMLQALQDAGIVRPTGERVTTGSLTVHKCQLLVQREIERRTSSELGTTRAWPGRHPSRGEEHER